LAELGLNQSEIGADLELNEKVQGGAGIPARHFGGQCPHKIFKAVSQWALGSRKNMKDLVGRASVPAYLGRATCRRDALRFPARRFF
jgi:hypothetical protein